MGVVFLTKQSLYSSVQIVFVESDARLGLAPKTLFDNFSELDEALPRTIARPGFPSRPPQQAFQLQSQQRTAGTKAPGAAKKARKSEVAEPGSPQTSHWSAF
jgi:hypothetical protein